MELKDYITIVISLLALALSLFNFVISRRKSTNLFTKLSVLINGIESDINSIHFIFKSIHLFPWGHHYKESNELSFQSRKILLQQKIDSFNELLVQDLKIKRKDKENIFSILMGIEGDLFELVHYLVEEEDDLEACQNFINSMLMGVRTIKDIISKAE
ncbi:hypothetical protein [Paenibacillus woosongensis]|uniref:Uncharacterized protein n=1 Tax=Paenibacillus woosongensis TaxID=307580 RepID=A0A7X2Z0T6_9BACL|nr:hypothetical protein [Paenibacillus woosongensis]MUG45511.1 hypothetical protein [Paenibacillus woosongensis]